MSVKQHLDQIKHSWTAAFVVIAFTAVAGLVLLQTAFAATGSVYLSPSSTSMAHGSSVTLSLRINPGATVDGVQATINFDSSELQYVSLSTSSSAFPIQLSQSVGSSSIQLSRGDLSGGV
ncbi:hypothetical protein KC963_05635, partial [Candidatus Saccharibacteria bacterium]|nr:hypothetical protein [Candidatus Saccharibacteria bacterium]